MCALLLPKKTMVLFTTVHYDQSQSVLSVDAIELMPQDSLLC